MNGSRVVQSCSTKGEAVATVGTWIAEVERERKAARTQLGQVTPLENRMGRQDRHYG